MATYIRLIRLTDKGRTSTNRGGEMTKELRGIVEANGGAIKQLWATMGRYDFVAVVEAADDRTMLRISAKVAATGYLVAETMPATPMDDFLKAVA